MDGVRIEFRVQGLVRSEAVAQEWVYIPYIIDHVESGERCHASDCSGKGGSPR